MKRLLSVICLLLFVIFKINAQRFPINVIPRVNPPAPVNFYSYADAGTINSPLRVQLLLNDITVNDRQISLRVSFQGNGINFQSTQFVSGAPTLFISGGTLLELTNAELAPYFELQNLRGINPNTYGKVIPEGSYQFCFEIFDFVTGNRLSERSCATTYIYRNEPPLLNLPLNKENLLPQLVDNIVFQWTPRQINVSNVEYELSIVEIWDDTVDPQTVFLSSPPVFQITTRANSYVYGPSDPLLLPDKRYAWQVRAKALQGAEEVGMFRNEGKSEIFWFSRTEPCDPPQNVYAETKGISKINVFWDENPAVYTEYTIAYRETDKPGAQWFTMKTNSSWATVWDLKPSTTYEFKLKAKCKYQYSPYTDVQLITTDSAEDETANYNCGIVPDAISITNREPYNHIFVGDRITAGDFVVTITDLESESEGWVTGRGFVSIPYLEFARFAVKFDRIFVNSDFQLAEGEIITLYDPTFGEGAEMTQDINLDFIEIIRGDQGEITFADVGYEIEDIRIEERDGVSVFVVTGTNGEEGVVSVGDDMIIRDSSGQGWAVGEDGEIQQVEIAEGGSANEENTLGIIDGDVEELTAKGVRVDFETSGFYSYDIVSDGYPSGLVEKYEKLQFSNGEEYMVPYKAISNSNGEDFVKAKIKITDPEISTENIVFKTKKGKKVNVDWDGDEAVLSLKKSFDYAIEEILATVKPKNDSGKYTVAGKLNLAHLGSNKVEDVKVVVIPINGANIVSRLDEKINDIYNKAGVNFDIEIANTVQIPQADWDFDENGMLDVGDSSILSYYTDEENAVSSYVKNQINYQSDVYYIFVINFPLSEASLSGFMPLKKQYGFVFGTTNQARTIAHELGHGIFGLEHPFAKYDSPQGATNLLMDYGGGTHLNHLDWKKMHAPGLQLYLFQGDEDGASNNIVKNKTEKLKKALEHLKKRYEGKRDELVWRSLLTEKAGQGTFAVDKFISLVGKYNITLEETKLKFELKNQPSAVDQKISVSPGDEYFEIKERSILKGVYYELTIKTDKDDFVFKFDHHDDLEAFSNYFKIDRDQIHEAPYTSNYSIKIIDYLNEKYFPEGGITIGIDCDKIDTYFSEIPSDYLSYIHDQDFLSNEKLWSAFSSLLSCSVNDKGVSEEDAVITIMEALGKRTPDVFLSKLKSETIDNQIAFRKLYSRLDNWGGEDNFTKAINILYDVWKKSGLASNSVRDIPYESNKVLGFYVSDYDVTFEGDTAIKLEEEVVTTVQDANEYSGIRVIREKVDLGTYDIYYPIKLLKYENIVDPGFSIKSVEIPMFILKAIAENYSTSNTDRGTNFAFEAALTVSGVGNITKLRHITKLGKLDDLVQTLQGADAIVSSINLILKYSTVCDVPKGNQAGQQNASVAKTFCDKLGFFGDAIGLAGGIGGLAQRAAIKRNANDLRQEIEDNPQLITNESARDDIVGYLKKIAKDIDPNEINLEDLKRLVHNVSDQTLLDFETTKLALSTVEFLLKYSGGCDADETCKAVKFYLDVIQKGIKAGDLSIKIKKGTEDFLKKIEEDPDAFDNPTKRAEIVREMEVVIGNRTSSLDKILRDARYVSIKNMFDHASPSRRVDLREAWRVLESFEQIRVVNNGKNLSILADAASRFTYNGNVKFEGLKSLLVDGSKASKQKLIDGLEQVNQIFDSNLPIKFSGIKAGDVKVIITIDGKSQEVARITNQGEFLKKKFLENGNVVGNYDGIDILQQGDEVGFRKND